MGTAWLLAGSGSHWDSVSGCVPFCGPPGVTHAGVLNWVRTGARQSMVVRLWTYQIAVH